MLLLGQQHGDEPASAEALLLVAQALATGDLAPLLDHIDVTVLPRANPDGAQWQRPVVVVDAHEHTVLGRYLDKFNAVQRHDLLLQYAMTAKLPEPLGRAGEDWFRQPIIAALAAAGLSTDWYYTNPTTAGDLRLFMGRVQPNTGRNVNGLRNPVSLLLESRGVGIGQLHLARRVHSQVVAVSTVLRQAARHAEDLLALQARADAEVVAAACGGRAVVQAQGTPMRRERLFIDPVTGADKPITVDWQSALAVGAGLARDHGTAAALRLLAGRRPSRCGQRAGRAGATGAAFCRGGGLAERSLGGNRTRRGDEAGPARFCRRWLSQHPAAGARSPARSRRGAGRQLLRATRPTAGQPGDCRAGARQPEQLPGQAVDRPAKRSAAGGDQADRALAAR